MDIDFGRWKGGFQYFTIYLMFAVYFYKYILD